MQLKDLHQKIIDALQNGDFVSPIKEFYAEDVVAQTNNEVPVTGRDAIANAEAEYVEGVSAFRGIEVFATAVDDRGDGTGTVFYECRMRWAHTGNANVDVQQTVVERWVNGNIAAIRFYGDIVL